MAHGASTSRPRRFPIAVEVKNEFAKGVTVKWSQCFFQNFNIYKGYGVLPMSITSEFGSRIGRRPTIGAADGQIYCVRFEKTSDGGLLTTVSACWICSIMPKC